MQSQLNHKPWSFFMHQQERQTRVFCFCHSNSQLHGNKCCLIHFSFNFLKYECLKILRRIKTWPWSIAHAAWCIWILCSAHKPALPIDDRKINIASSATGLKGQVSWLLWDRYKNCIENKRCPHGKMDHVLLECLCICTKFFQHFCTVDDEAIMLLIYMCLLLPSGCLM